MLESKALALDGRPNEVSVAKAKTLDSKFNYSRSHAGAHSLIHKLNCHFDVGGEILKPVKISPPTSK